MYNKLPGGMADGMEKKDFSKKDQQAIDKGAKIESEEHGAHAPNEIAADHVVEHGAKYYNEKTGLPAMERKMENKMEKANPAVRPAEMSEGMKVAYDPNMSPEEHVARVKMHNKHAVEAARSGNRDSSVWHHQQAYKHHLAAIGKPPALPEHVIEPAQKAEKGVHMPSMGSIKIGEKEGSIKGRSFAGDLVRQGRPEMAHGWHMEKLQELRDMRKKQEARAALKKEDKQYAPKIEEKSPAESVKKSGNKEQDNDHADDCKCPECHLPTFYGKHKWDGKVSKKKEESVKKSIQYATAGLSKSIKYKCSDCHTEEHNQWVDSAKKSESCKKCGTPLKKSGIPEAMPDHVRNKSKVHNTVAASQHEELEKATVIQPKPAKHIGGEVTPPTESDKTSETVEKSSKWSSLLQKGNYYRFPKKGQFRSPKEWDEPSPAQDAIIHKRVMYESKKIKEGKLWSVPRTSPKEGLFDKDHHTVIEKNDGSMVCDCKGFKFRKNCSHVAEAQKDKSGQESTAKKGWVHDPSISIPSADPKQQWPQAEQPAQTEQPAKTDETKKSAPPSDGTVQPDAKSSKWSILLNKAKDVCSKLPKLEKEMDGMGAPDQMGLKPISQVDTVKPQPNSAGIGSIKGAFK